jgi:hypothetical protein
MTDKTECRGHWYHEQDGDINYCRDCLVILEVKPVWSGTLTIGKMQTPFETPATSLDFKALLVDHLGTDVNLENVSLVKGTYSWDKGFDLVFSIGKNWMYGHLEASNHDQYTPTDRFYEPKMTQEELESLSIAEDVGSN